MALDVLHAFEDEYFALESHHRYYRRVKGSKDYFAAVMRLLGG